MELELGPLRFGIIGAGRLGCVLGRALQQRGFEVVHASSMSEAGRTRATKLLGVPVHSDPTAVTAGVDCVIISVPDDALGHVLDAVAARPTDANEPRLRIVSTSSFGGMTPLIPLAEAGVDVGIMHPMASIVDAGMDPDLLTGCGAAIGATDDASRSLMNALTHALGMLAFNVPDHAWDLHAAACSIASNGIIALLCAIEDLADEAGLHPDAARAAYGKLAALNVERGVRVGSVDALAGPIVRGDAISIASQVSTVRESATQADALLIPIIATLANRAFTSGRIEMDDHRALLEAVLDPTQFHNLPHSNADSEVD